MTAFRYTADDNDGNATAEVEVGKKGTVDGPNWIPKINFVEQGRQRILIDAVLILVVGVRCQGVCLLEQRQHTAPQPLEPLDQ